MYIIGIIGAANLVALIIWLYLYSLKEIRYVDRSGIENNPPTFIETFNNKTINFKIQGKVIRLDHLSFLDTMRYVSKIAKVYRLIHNYYDNIDNDAFKGRLLTELELIGLVDTISVTLYKLSKPHLKLWERAGRKRWMLNRGREDIMFTIGIARELFDYWQHLGNALAPLSQGATETMILGERVSLNTIKRDMAGMRLLEPRHESSIYISITKVNLSKLKSAARKPELN